MKTVILGCAAAIASAFAWTGYSQERADPKVPFQATVDGNYSNLLRTIEVPGDEQSYGEFYDFGHYAGTEYAGQQDLPRGYWVYVAPKWYIWKDSKRSTPVAACRPADPFMALVNKRVRIRIQGENITGEVVENHQTYLLLKDDSSTKQFLVNKSQVAFVEWSE